MGLFGGRKRKQRLAEAGVDAPAVLTAVRDTGVTINNNPRIEMTLQVTAADGSGTFEVSKKQTVSRVAIPSPGATLAVRYDPQDPENLEILGATEGDAAGAQVVSLEGASASAIAGAVQGPAGGAVAQGSAAELLASGQRMTAVVREFSPSGKTVGEMNPGAQDPQDPVYVFKTEMQVDGASPIEAVFLHRVPVAKQPTLTLGGRLDVAVNPANPTREVAIDWATSPLGA